MILDKRLLTAPRIMSKVSDRGMISGGSMSDREVELTAEVLKAGVLPYPIRLVEEKRAGQDK
jgi:preprotein translocase subunit SecD